MKREKKEIKYNFTVITNPKPFKVTDEDITRLCNECFYENEHYDEIKRTFKALAKK